MNKIASILFLEDLGLCRTPIYFATGNIEKIVKNIYDYGEWVVRCGDAPDIKKEPEPYYLPWGLADNPKKLISKIREIQAQVPNQLVFIHKQREIIKSGTLLVDIPDIIIEGNNGDLQRMIGHEKGRFNPDSRYYFKKDTQTLVHREGKDVFTAEELYKIMNVEKKIPYNISSIFFRQFSIEFSFNPLGDIDCHDIYLG